MSHMPLCMSKRTAGYEADSLRSLQINWKASSFHRPATLKILWSDDSDECCAENK